MRKKKSKTMPMIITVAGQAGAGKDTVGDLLGKKLKLRVVKATMKNYARSLALDVLEFEKTEAARSKKWDLRLDAWQRAEARRENCVLVSMLSAWNAPRADLKVWLCASERERARRIAKRDKIPLRQALKYVRQRDATTRRRLKKAYGVDPWDPLLYDLCINTGKLLPEQTVQVVLAYLKPLRK